MKGLRKVKVVCLLAGLIVTFGIVMSGSTALAQDQDPPYFFATLLQGQGTGTISTSSANPFGLFTIGVTSIGNRTLSSSLTMTSRQSGLWTLFLFGTGGRTWADVSVGIAPFSGPPAQIDIGQGVSFGFAIGYILILDAENPVTADDPIRFGMSVTGS